MKKRKLKVRKFKLELSGKQQEVDVDLDAFDETCTGNEAPMIANAMPKMLSTYVLQVDFRRHKVL